MKLNISIMPLATFVAMAATAQAATHEPYGRSRIFWDPSSQVEVGTSGGYLGNYGRVLELADGRLLAVAEMGGIAISWSEDMGATWTAAERIIANPSGYSLCVPDLIEMPDGTLVIGYNPRPTSPYSEDRLFSIRCLRSTDGGKNWSSPINVFDSNHSFNDGCWEPSFLLLPSGELQCYFANETEYTYNDDQCISMCRSFDAGATWSEPVKISYRAGSRDGMPAAILDKDNSEIIVTVEDNGWPGHISFVTTTVRCPLEENWTTGYVEAASNRREWIFEAEPDKSLISAAPYLRRMANGETIASFQGNEGRANNDLDYFDMFVLVGDEHARNFKGQTRPFMCSLSEHSIWNSVATFSDGTVMAVGSIGTPNQGNNRINVVRGYPMRGFTASPGTPALDGTVEKLWREVDMRRIYLCDKNHPATADLLYDNDCLYVAVSVKDRTLYTDKVDNDAVKIYLDPANLCDTYPQEGIHEFTFDAAGNISYRRGNKNRWITGDVPEGVASAVRLLRYDYMIEAAIPWSALGFDAPPLGQTMRVNIEVLDRTDDDRITYAIADALSRASWTWPELYLDGGGDAPSAIDGVAADAVAAQAFFSTGDGLIKAVAACGIDRLEVYSPSGALAGRAFAYGANEAAVPIPSTSAIAIAVAQLADGTRSVGKLALR